jgi:hypothetical protein
LKKNTEAKKKRLKMLTFEKVEKTEKKLIFKIKGSECFKKRREIKKILKKIKKQ